MEDNREPHPSVGSRKINRRDIEMQAILRMRNAVGRRSTTAFVAGMPAIIRILVAQAEHRPAGNGDERRHRHLHDDGEPLRPFASAYDLHVANYTTIPVNGLVM